MKYKVLGTNDIQKFVQVMMRCKIPQNIAFGEGIDENVIEEVNRLAVSRGIAILTLPNGLLEGEDQERKFIFIPKDKDAKGPFGVFVPITVGDSVENHKHFIETPVLPSMEDIRRAGNIPEGMMSKAEQQKKYPLAGFKKFVGRPERKDNINTKDEKRLKFLLEKDMDVDDFLKCIDEEEKK